MQIEEVREFISNTSAETKIYIGADSERFKKKNVWYATFTVAVVVHYDGCSGCKVFGDVSTERDIDQKSNKPFHRMMMETYKASAIYLELAEAIGDRHVEIHLDINPSELHGSNVALAAAIGYVRGVCNIIPMVKPNAPIASYCADRLREIIKC